MKLPRFRRRAVAETAAPPPDAAAPTSTAPVSPPGLSVLAYSKTGLPDQEFNAQTEKLRSVVNYDADARNWYAWLPLDQPERAAKVLTALFEVARVHGTTIQVRADPAAESSPPGQAAGTP